MESVEDMSIDFWNPSVRIHMSEGNFGLEKESLRVTPEGFLAHTKHPFPDNPNMDRDFCENQTELITEVAKSTEEVWEKLAMLQKKAVNTLLTLETGRELMWPFSNPPYVKGEQDIPIAEFHGINKGKELYREYLAGKYGKRKMLFSGIHFNFSFSEAFLQAAYEQSGFAGLQEYKNSIYMELAKKVVRYSWLIVYLTAASPVMDGSFFCENDIGKDVLNNLASPRCSKNGYWNDFDPILEYTTLQDYVASIEEYVEQGQLKEASELYCPVRLKPRGVNTLAHLKETGVDHIELRMLDLNPLEPVGISKEDLKFIHLLILYLMSLEDGDFRPFEQIMAMKNVKRAAKYDEQDIQIETGWDSSLPVREAAGQILASMKKFFEELNLPGAAEAVAFQEKKVSDPEERYAVKIKNRFYGDYVKRGIELARQYADELKE